MILHQHIQHRAVIAALGIVATILIVLTFDDFTSSFLGSLTTIGTKGGRAVTQINFDQGETSETLATYHLNIVFVPDAADISHGLQLSDVITSGKRIYGYKYSSRSAAAEIAAKARADSGEPLTFSELFPGQFFASDRARRDNGFIADFEAQKNISFLPLSEVTLERNAQYVIVTNDAETTFTVRGLPWCGDGLVSDPSGVLWSPIDSVPEHNEWRSVTYGNKIFVAVSMDGRNRVMTSPDGVTWTARSVSDVPWSVTYGRGLFVALSSDNVMTSSNGVTWDRRSVPRGSWGSVTYGNGIFVAVSQVGDPTVMTSPNGTHWTAYETGHYGLTDVTYGNGLFVAVSSQAPNQVTTSPDGVHWTVRPVPVLGAWAGVAYGNGRFVAVSGETGTSGRRVISSPDGITWTARISPTNPWTSVTYGNGLFVAVADAGSQRVMTSPDGVLWTPSVSAGVNAQWKDVVYGDRRFVAVSDLGVSVIASTGCDDGNTDDGDGCSAMCTIEYTPPVCGDHLIEGTEEMCDDGNTDDGDGCSGTCHIEYNFPVCGNRVEEGSEECDDGNAIDDDHCSALCQLKPGQCGDGFLNTGERCDDGNQEEGDGCNAVCMVEVCSTIAGTNAQGGIITVADPNGDGLPDLMATGPDSQIGGDWSVTWFNNQGIVNDYRLGKHTMQIGTRNSMIYAMGVSNNSLFLTDGRSDTFGVMKFEFPFFQPSVRFSSLSMLFTANPSAWITSADTDANGATETIFCTLHGILRLAGSFTHDPVTTISTRYCKAISATDVDDDGDTDLLAYEQIEGNAGGIRLYENEGNGSFHASRTLVTNDVNSNIYFFAASDINNDGIQDFAIAENDSQTISIVISDGNGWYAQNDILVGSSAMSIVINDFTGDGRADLAYAIHEDRTLLTIVPGNGDGTFGAPRGIPLAEPIVRTLVSADFDEDRDIDVAYILANGTVRILMNDGRGYLSSNTSACRF